MKKKPLYWDEYINNAVANESYLEYVDRAHRPITTFGDVYSLYYEDEFEGQDPEYYEN